MDLFSGFQDNQNLIQYPIKDGELVIKNNFLSESKSKEYLENFLISINWKQEKIKLYGKTFDIPRKTAWYGYEGFDYSYSGINCNPEAWTTELMEIKREVEKYLPGENFNSVLLNLYRDGNDRVSWHSDNEKELGVNPTIASISLGAIRRFDIKHKTDELQNFKFELQPGSLIIMKGAFQHNWLHQVPVQKKVSIPRINLTFRTIKY